jgi:hypothetical protein
MIEISTDLSGLKSHQYDKEIKEFLYAIVCTRVISREEEEKVRAYKLPEPKEETSDYFNRIESEETRISPIMVV